MANLPLIYNSRLIKLFSTYLSQHYAHLDADRILSEAHLSKFEVDDPGHWFDQNQVDLFYQKVLEATGNPAIAREVGRNAPFSNAGGAIKQHVLGLLNISSIYLLLSKLYPLLSRGAQVTTRRTGANKVEIIATPEPGVNEKPYQCENRLGIFESLSTLFTAKHATILHDCCIHRGHPHCRYEVQWEEPPFLRWKRVFRASLIVEFLVILAGHWIFPTPFWLSFVAAGCAGLLGISMTAGHLEKQELRRTIQNQGNVAEDHIKEVDYRYRGALLVQKIGQATSGLLDLNQLFQEVIGNIRDYLDFDRGVLMLADEKRQRLVYAAGFGFDEEKTEILCKTRFRLDNPDAKGIFIQTFKEQRPILVDDVNALHASFSARSQVFARQIGSKSLICLPIVYESQSLGILAVDNIKSKRQLTQSDVNLLLGVTYQTGASIFSMMAYKKLRASEERYRSLYDSAPTPYFSISTESGIILNCNMAAAHLLGHSRAELLGSAWLDHFSKDEGNRVRAEWVYQALQQGRSIQNEEVRLLCKNGQSVWADLSMEPFKDAQGKVIEGRCVLIDMTERKKLEEKLRNAQKMEAMGTLAGGVAHDLSNILAAIVSYPDLLLMDIEPGSHLYEPLTKIRSAGLRAAAIVQDLLTLARLGVQLTEVVDFNGIVLDYLRGPEFENLKVYHPNVQVRTDLSKDIAAVRGSSVHLLKTLMNIVNNAAEAMPEGGIIRIATRNLMIGEETRHKNRGPGPYVVVSIRDEGAGIAEEDIGRIFEPFFTKKMMGRSGTGLGMAIVWAAVQGHKGFIEVTSRIGKGTNVELFFPATKESCARQAGVPLIEDLMGHGESVLVIDDEVEHRDIASKMLSRLGYQVTAVGKAQDALAEVARNPPDVLVLDMVLGSDMDGLAVYRRILSLHPVQKAVITSGYSETYRVKQALEIGAGAYIKKPYSLREIAAAVRKELDKSSSTG